MRSGALLRFEVREGPRLDPVAEPDALDLLRPEVDQAVLAPIYETIRLVAQALPPASALLGFLRPSHSRAGRSAEDRSLAPVCGQPLSRQGVRMEFPQSVPNLTEASQNLYELTKAATWSFILMLTFALRSRALWRSSPARLADHEW
jgi:hypothetical protein